MRDRPPVYPSTMMFARRAAIMKAWRAKLFGRFPSIAAVHALSALMNVFPETSGHLSANIQAASRELVTRYFADPITSVTGIFQVLSLIISHLIRRLNAEATLWFPNKIEVPIFELADQPLASRRALLTSKNNARIRG